MRAQLYDGCGLLVACLKCLLCFTPRPSVMDLEGKLLMPEQTVAGGRKFEGLTLVP